MRSPSNTIVATPSRIIDEVIGKKLRFGESQPTHRRDSFLFLMRTKSVSVGAALRIAVIDQSNRAPLSLRLETIEGIATVSQATMLQRSGREMSAERCLVAELRNEPNAMLRTNSNRGFYRRNFLLKSSWIGSFFVPVLGNPAVGSRRNR